VTNAEFIRLRGEQTNARFRLADQKSQDYASQEDRLSNFKLVAQLTGQHPIEVWSTYWMKHTLAICRYVRSQGREQLSEPIEGRIDDLQNYLDFLRALISETAADPNDDSTGVCW
jgi:hypothetical protein